MILTDKEIKKTITAGTIAVTGEEYYLPTDQEIDEFLESERVVDFVLWFSARFQKSIMDCSWAAWGFVWLFAGMGWAVSYEVLKGHALVRIVNSDKKEVWVEPQTGKRVENTRKLILTVMP